MILEYTGRQTVVTTKLKAQAEVGLASVALVTQGCTSAHVILTEDKYRKIAEVKVSCRGDKLVARCEAKEMETALHDALHTVEQQALKRRKRVETVRDHPKAIVEEAV